MQNTPLDIAGERLEPRPSGALHWPRGRLLVVADLHLGVAERRARRGGALLPPYEDGDTLARLAAEVAALDPLRIVCLGDSFDDGAAAVALDASARALLARLATGRRWDWIAGNHDPRPPADLPGSAGAELRLGPLVLRHIPAPEAPAPGLAELSGHLHPKARLLRAGRLISRRCFVAGGGRVVLPAFGTYTGGLDVLDPAFDALFDGTARVLMLGRSVTPVLRARLRPEGAAA